MKIVRLKTAVSYEPEKDWRRASLCNEEDVSVEHFVKPPGHASPRHSHLNAQVLVVLAGRLLIIDGNNESQELSAGDAAYIPGGEPHVVYNALAEPATGLDIFVPGRSFDFWRSGK